MSAKCRRSPAKFKRSLCHAIRKASSDNYRFNKRITRIDIDHILPAPPYVKGAKAPLIGEQLIMQHQGPIKTLSRSTPKRLVRATGLVAAILIAGVALTFTSAPVDATPKMVTKDKPCGSCHPPNKPPGK